MELQLRRSEVQGRGPSWGQAVEVSRLIDPLDNEGAANTGRGRAHTGDPA